MDIKPFIVWHSDAVIKKEGALMESDEEYADNWQGSSARRYLVWATSRLEAARTVQADKKKNNRLFPDVYEVCSLRTNIGEDENPVKEFSDEWRFEESYKEQTYAYQHDVDAYDTIFGDPVQVKL